MRDHPTQFCCRWCATQSSVRKPHRRVHITMCNTQYRGWDVGWPGRRNERVRTGRSESRETNCPAVVGVDADAPPPTGQHKQHRMDRRRGGGTSGRSNAGRMSKNRRKSMMNARADRPRHQTRPRRGHGHLVVIGTGWRRGASRDQISGTYSDRERGWSSSRRQHRPRRPCGEGRRW